jgi:hypothetical protein
LAQAKLTPKQIIKIIYAPDNIARLQAERTRYELYNGRLRKYIEQAIRGEFILQETVEQLISRIVPLNIVQKIVNKLAKIYMENPDRSSIVEKPADDKAVKALTDAANLNMFMKLANRYFKLSKHTCVEPYVNGKGTPKVRVLPAHTYTPISADPVENTEPTYMIKHQSWVGPERKNHVHVVWSDNEHYTMTGEGIIIPDPGNEKKKNPFGTNPLIYIKESLDELIPIEDDDLLFMQIAICLLLTDLAFATKYQAWSLIYTIGVKGQKLTFNPNSVINLPMGKGTDQKPEIGTIKPEMDSDAMLRQVEVLVGMLLTTKSLSVGDVSGNLTAQSAASGVAKVLDSSESTEDRRDQFAFFSEGESRVFNFFKVAIPYWTQTKQLAAKYVTARLSPEFELSIKFKDPSPRTSESESVKTQIEKRDGGLTSQRRALAAANPDLTDSQLDQLQEEIDKENKVKADKAKKEMADAAKNDPMKKEASNQDGKASETED